MSVKQFEIWLASLDPAFGTEAGKTQPVLVVQSNLLNQIHPSTLVCPVTTKVHLEVHLLRVNLKKGMASLNEDSAIMIDQVKALDNRRLLKKIGTLPKHLTNSVKENLRIILDLGI